MRPDQGPHPGKSLGQGGPLWKPDFIAACLCSFCCCTQL